MIITCPNCKKKFNIDPTLVPEDGRDLQCGSCNHVWFYKAEDERESPLTLNENISKDKVELDTETIDKNLQEEKTNKPEIKKEISKEIPEIITKSANKGANDDKSDYMIKFDTTIRGRFGADYFKSTVKSISYTSVTIEWE